MASARRMDLRDTFVIARREFLERVRSRWFAVITVLGPIGMIALVLVPALLVGRGTEGTRIEIIDRTHVEGRADRVAQALSGRLLEKKWKPAIVEAGGRDEAEIDRLEMARIRAGEINGFVTIPAGALEASGDAGKVTGDERRRRMIRYRGDNASSEGIQKTLGEAVQDAVQRARGQDAGIPSETLTTLLAPPIFASEHTNGETEGASGFASFVIAYMLAFILYMVITLYGFNVMRSVVQEKTSRVMELMVATVKPRSLMAGKILGVGAAGLVQVAVWLAMGAITLAYRAQILGWFGASGQGPGLPPIALGEIAIVIVYFVLGFFFYASMYAAVGAMVSSEQDTQQAQMPITMVLVAGVLCLQLISNDPRGSTASIMTMVPFWSPLLMPMRYVLGGATPVDVAISVTILLVSTVLIARAAAKIYRMGVLMYGKRPSLPELLRWLRY